MQQPQNILIRLPNWLGDMVMSSAFVKAVCVQYPTASIDLIAKKGLDFLLDFFPAHQQRFVFSKDEFKGISGAWKFGKKLQQQKKYDLFFCLPDSFSSALMGYAITAKKKVGYTKELRNLLLTNAYSKNKGLHRVDEYIDLLQQFCKKEIAHPSVQLLLPGIVKTNTLVININSEADSRRLPAKKAISLISHIREKLSIEIMLVGSHKEKAFVDEVFNALPDQTGITNKSGQTNLTELMHMMAAAQLVLTTDSGPAHIANALGVYTIVLFGAGNEKNTAPYNQANRTILRLGQLPCEPCVSNTCKLYGIPQCLALLDEHLIVHEVEKLLNYQ